MQVRRMMALSAISCDRVPVTPATLSLVDHLRNGGIVPPVHVRLDCGVWKILDGRHRVTAYRLLGMKEIEVRYGQPHYHCANCDAIRAMRLRKLGLQWR